MEKLSCKITTAEIKTANNMLDKIQNTKNTERERDNLEKQINDMVYKLYQLSEEEIKIVEENGS